MIGVPGVRETLLFARAQPLPVTVDEVAAATRVHRNVARSRLDRLVEAGLLVSSFERRSGRSGPGAGRPARIYRVAPELSAIEFPPRHYEHLIGYLVEAMPAYRRQRRLREAGAAFGRRIANASELSPASGLREAFERVCVAIGTLGYQAAVEGVTAEGATIATPTCPLRPLVRARHETAEIDRGMWAALVECALPKVAAVEAICETHDCLDDHASCRVVVSLRSRPKR